MIPLGLFMMVPGMMLLAGEYLCMEVAWHCIDYNQFYTGLGALLLGIGSITTIMGVNND